MAIDTETTGLLPEDSEVIEIGMARMKSAKTPFMWGSLICPEGDIPPEASAVNHITKKMCEGMPSMHSIEPTILKHSEGNVLLAQNAQFDISFLPFLKERVWICTKRLSQHIWPDAPGYSLQILRYWLDLESPEGDPHRATADASLCASLFEREIKVYLERGLPNDVDSLVAYAKSQIKYKYLPLGKYRNESIASIVKKDKNYLNWMLNKMDDLDDDLRYSIVSEIRQYKLFK